MTGFGKGVAELPDKKITVEVKSLNSKQADIAARIPQSLRGVELEMRQLTAATLLRGKIDITVSVDSVAGDAQQVLNIPALRQYAARIAEMRDALNLPEPADWYSLLLRFPDSMRAESAPDADSNESEAAMEALKAALDALMAYRRVEGEKLEQFFTLRVQHIADMLAEVPRWEGERVVKIRARMEEGLANLNGVDFDRSRLEQELFFYIEKLDINEEKQRLAQHLEYFLQTMASDDPSQGKKLGFIAQEMGREINTLGSKSNHSEMQRLVVMMKDELEQIKEQVLNVL